MLPWNFLRPSHSLLLALLWLPGGVVAVAQEPEPNEAEAYRLVWRESLRPVAVDAHGTLTKLRTAVERMERLAAEEKLATVRAEEFAEAQSASEKLNRLSSQLMLAGEPFGHDLQLQTAHLLNRLQQQIGAFRSFPTVDAQISASRVTYGRMGQAAAAQLPRIGNLFQQDKLDEAETMFYRAWDPLAGAGLWFDSATREGGTKPLQAAKAAIEEKRRQQVREEAVEWIEAELASTRPNYPGLLAEVQQAATGLEAAATANWRGESLAGPELFRRAVAAWQEADRAATRCRACEWALSGITSQNRPGLAALELAQKSFIEQYPDALAGLIRAGGRRSAAAGDAANQYADWVAAVAESTADWSEASLLAPLESALEEFAAAEEQLAAQVSAYRETTDEWLRWQRRKAAAYAKALGAAPPLKAAAAEAAAAENHAAGLLSGGGASFITARLSQPSTTAHRVLAKELTNKEVFIAGPLAPAEAGEWNGPYEGRIQATLSAELSLQAAAARLRESLYAGASPPLSFAGARAAVRAERGIFRAGGGTVQNLELEPLIRHFATPEPGPSQAGAVVHDLLDPPVFAHTMLHVQLRADWLEHDCFVLKIAP